MLLLLLFSWNKAKCRYNTSTGKISGRTNIKSIPKVYFLACCFPIFKMFSTTTLQSHRLNVYVLRGAVPAGCRKVPWWRALRMERPVPSPRQAPSRCAQCFPLPFRVPCPGGTARTPSWLLCSQPLRRHVHLSAAFMASRGFCHVVIIV